MIFKFTWPGTPRGDIYLKSDTVSFPHGDADHVSMYDGKSIVQLTRRGLEVYVLDESTGKTIDRPRLPLPTGVGCPNE